MPLILEGEALPRKNISVKLAKGASIAGFRIGESLLNQSYNGTDMSLT